MQFDIEQRRKLPFRVKRCAAMMRHILFIKMVLTLVWIWCPMNIEAQQENDSIQYECNIEKPQTAPLLISGTLIAVGSFGVCNGWMHQVRNEVRDKMYDLRCKKFPADDYLQYLPVTVSVLGGSFGIKSRFRMRERLALATTSSLFMAIIVNGLKYSIREPRPDNGTHNSFPSGHTATAFMGAELMRLEYGGVWGWMGYGVATCIAVSRLYNDRHWLNDVLAGAGIGILSVQLSYWLLPIERKWFGWSENNGKTMIPSCYIGQDGLGIALCMEF